MHVIVNTIDCILLLCFAQDYYIIVITRRALNEIEKKRNVQLLSSLSLIHGILPMTAAFIRNTLNIPTLSSRHVNHSSISILINGSRQDAPDLLPNTLSSCTRNYCTSSLIRTYPSTLEDIIKSLHKIFRRTTYAFSFLAR